MLLPLGVGKCEVCYHVLWCYNFHTKFRANWVLCSKVHMMDTETSRHTHTHTYMHTYIHTYIHIHTHIHTYIHIHIHIHTEAGSTVLSKVILFPFFRMNYARSRPNYNIRKILRILEFSAVFFAPCRPASGRTPSKRTVLSHHPLSQSQLALRLL
jgi:hypothetical protein